jgi:hypothetical protein
MKSSTKQFHLLEEFEETFYSHIHCKLAKAVRVFTTKETGGNNAKHLYRTPLQQVTSLLI